MSLLPIALALLAAAPAPAAAPAAPRAASPAAAPTAAAPTAASPAAAPAAAASTAAASPAAASSAAAPSTTDADAAFARGVAALQAKNAATAVRELEACVAAQPARVACRWELGWAFWLQGRFAEVIAQWEEVARLDPKHPEVGEHLERARAEQKLRAALAAPPPPAPPRSPPPPGARLRLRAVGDVMLGTSVPEGELPPDDGATLLDGVQDWLADADLTFVNLEGPLCDGGTTSKCRSPRNCYAFRSPTRYGRYLKAAGVDLASTANNHAGDFGEFCRRATEKTLDELGIAWSGPPGSMARLTSNGLRVAMIAFYTGDNANRLQDTPNAKALVAAAARDHDVVIVSFHGGAEGAKAARVPYGRELFLGEDRGDLRTFARAVVDAGADLVIGHGPHLLRGFEVYQERLIAYSLGNFATYGRFNLSGALGVGAVLEASLDGEGRFLGGKLLPTRQLGEGVPVKDPQGAAIAAVRRLSTEDFGPTAVQVADDGTLSSPKAPGAAR